MVEYPLWSSRSNSLDKVYTMENSITIFGTRWCGDCIRTCKILDKHKIKYKWVDIDQDEAGAEFVISKNHGMRSVPTILLNDGSIIVEPSDYELKQLIGTLFPSN